MRVMGGWKAALPFGVFGGTPNTTRETCVVPGMARGRGAFGDESGMGVMRDEGGAPPSEAFMA